MNDSRELNVDFEGFVAGLLRIEQEEKAARAAEAERERRQLGLLAGDHAALPPPRARPWTIPQIFGGGRQENFLSDYLAYLLDPSRNGIGEGPLAALLLLCGVRPDAVRLDEVRIQREYGLDGGRIDLLLEWPDELVIAIEVKIHSRENPGQTEHYARAIAKEFSETPQYCVFLTRGADLAGSHHFRPLSWAQLLGAFRAVTLPVGGECSPRQRLLWEDFLEHVEVFVIMPEAETFQFSEKAALYVQHVAVIKGVTSAFDNEWAAAASYLEARLQAHMTGGPWITDFDASSLRRDWRAVYKPWWANPNWHFHFEYWFTRSTFCEGRFGYALHVEGRDGPALIPRFDEASRRLGEQFQSRKIQYRPSHSAKSVAWKMYTPGNSVEAFAASILSAFDEFRFLESEVDALVNDLQGVS